MTGDINEQIEISVCNNIIQPDENEINQRRALNVFLSCVITGIILYAVSLLFKYIPNGLDTAYIQKIFYVSLSIFIPEIPERVGYIILVCLFPVLFMLSYWIIGRIKINNKAVRFCHYFYPLVLIGGIYFLYDINIKNPFLFKYSLLNNMFYVVIFVSLISVAAMFFYQSKYKRIAKIIDYIYIVISSAAALLVSSLYITKIYGLNYNEFYNFDAYYYPVFEVFHGRTILHDFINIYGFYPYLLAPILKLTGGITVERFSILMAVLVFIVLVSFLVIIWINVKNKIIAIIGYLALVYFSFLMPLSSVEGTYLAYQPHRMIFPALIILLCSFWLYVKKPVYKRILTFAGFVLSTLSLIWNLDAGIVVIGAWCLFLIYDNALKRALNDIDFYKNCIKTILYTFISAVASFIILFLITYFRTGEIISYVDLFYAQSFFYKYGFNMLPMPKYHPWMILIFLYLMGLVISLPNIKFLNIKKLKYSPVRSSMYFFISVIGFGSFVYYQGRSHDLVFFAVVWPGIILAVMLFQDCFKLFRNIKGNNLQETVSSFAYICQFILITILFVSYASAFFYSFKYDKTITALYNKNAYAYAETINDNYDIIKKPAMNYKNIDLLLQQQDYYYTRLGLSNPTGLPSCVDWYSREQIDKVFERMENTDNNIIFDKFIFDYLNKYNGQRFNKALDDRFVRSELGKGYFLYTLK